MTDYCNWWDEKDPLEAVWREFENLRDTQRHRYNEMVENLCTYTRRRYSIDGDYRVTRGTAETYYGRNATKSVLDTIVGLVTYQKPRPMFVTEGGRWDQRLRARNMQKVVDGAFNQADFYKKARLCVRDAGVTTYSPLKFYLDKKGRVCIDRLYAGYVVFDDDVENPDVMYQYEFVARSKLRAAYPKAKAEIDTVRATTKYDDRHDDRVLVMEAWKLPDDDETPGRHIISIKDKVLLDEEFTMPMFPIVIYKWSEPLVGFAGPGTVENLRGLNRESDYLMDKSRRAAHIAGTVYLLRHSTDKTPLDHFTNSIGAILEWSGNQAPQLVTNPIMHQQVFEYMKELYHAHFEEEGVSQMSATSKKPPGVESGKALQTLLSSESQRQSAQQLAYEEFSVECGKVVVELLRRHFKENPKTPYEVKSKNGRFVETVKWDKETLNADEYILQTWPTNLLPASPTGKLEAIKTLLETQVIDTHMAQIFLDFPDVEAAQNTATASLKNVLWIVDQVIYNRKWIEPRSFHNLTLGVQQMQQAMSLAQTEGAPEEVIQLGVKWCANAMALAAPPAPAAPPMGMDPTMTGMTPPGMLPGEAVQAPQTI